MLKRWRVHGRKVAFTGLMLVAVIEAQACSRVKQRSFIAEYQTPGNQALRDLEKKLKSDRLLETMADSFEEYLDLPVPVRISSAQCGMANAFYSPKDGRITLCYELIASLARLYSPDAKGEEMLRGAVTFVLSHELGHAVIDVLDLPVLGREEDAADELAALIALEDPHGAPVIVGAVTFLASTTKLGRPVSLPEMADEHALAGQRFFNMLCWVYGSNPSEGKSLVSAGLLSTERAAKCPDEFAQIRKSWYRLLGSHLKKPFDTPYQEAPNGGTIRQAPVPPAAPAPPTAPAPPITESKSSPPVKMSSTGICYAQGTGHYKQTKYFVPYSTLEECLAAGGRLPN